MAGLNNATCQANLETVLFEPPRPTEHDFKMLLIDAASQQDQAVLKEIREDIFENGKTPKAVFDSVVVKDQKPVETTSELPATKELRPGNDTNDYSGLIEFGCAPGIGNVSST